MKILCPSCERQYTIDDGKIPPKGILVKCSVCGAEFRAKKEDALPTDLPAEAGSEESPTPDMSDPGSTLNEAATDNALDDLFNDLTGASSTTDAADLDLDALHEKYSGIDLDAPEEPLATHREEPIQRTGDATIPHVESDPEPDDDSFIERNEDYTAMPLDAPGEIEAGPDASPPSAAESAVTNGGQDLLDSLFDDLGGTERIDQERTVNVNMAELSAPKQMPKAEDPAPTAPSPARAEKRSTEKQARAPEGIGAAPRDEALSDLFSDALGEDIERKIIEKSVMLGADEIDEMSSHDPASSGEIYIRKRQTNEVLGPFPEQSLAELMARGEVNKNDFVSYDGIRWEQVRDLGGERIGQTITASSQHTNEPGLIDLGGDQTGGVKLSLSGNNAFSADQPAAPGGKTGLFNDLISTFDDDLLQKREAVEHTMIPDVPGNLLDSTTPGSSEASAATGKRKKKKKKKDGVFFLFKIAIVLVIVSVIAAATAWWYKNRKPKTDVLERISETITESAGTLSDVRDSLLRDTRQDYQRSLGILKPYLRGEEIPPAVAGLDAQVKLLLYLSYGKKIEPIETIADRIETLYVKNPNDPDIVKAQALVAIARGIPDRAAAILEPLKNTSDPDILYALGLAAKMRKDLPVAENFFYAGYSAAEGKNNRLAYEMAEIKIAQGDPDGAIAFLNKTISASPYYLKAYLKKAETIAYDKKETDEAIRFLAAMDASTLSQADEAEKGRYYAVLGDLYYRQGAIANAIESYKRVTQIDKDNVDHLATLAKIYQETNQSALALEYYEKALAIDNRHVPSIIGKAEIFVRLKKYNDAFLEIAKVDQEKMDDPEQILRLGNLFYRQNEREKALQLYEQAIKRNPGLTEAYLGRVFIYFEMGMIDEVRKIVDNLAELDKESYSYYLIKAILYHIDGDFKKADESFQQSLKLNRMDDPRVFFYYGRFLLDRDDPALASEYFSKAVKQSLDDPEYRVSLANALEKQRRHKEVLAVLESVEGNQKIHAKAFQLRAEAYLRIGELDNALKQIESAIKIDPKNPYFFYKKGEVLYYREEYQPAIVSVETALMLDIKHFDSYVLFAKILLKKGDFKTAVEKLEEAERIDATNQQVFLLKGILFKNLDNYPEALRNFRRIKKNPELEKEALLEIGECYLNLERPDDARKYFVKAVQAGNKAGYRFLARIYYDRNDLSKAAIYYRHTLAAFPDDPEPIKQLGYIAKERKKYTKARSYFKRYIKHLRPGDPERKMIEDEIYYSEKNIGSSKLTRIRKEEREEEEVETREQAGDQFEDEPRTSAEEAKRIYMEAVSLVDSDKKGAERLLRDLMKKTPENNRYYIKSRKLLKRMKEDEESL